jgi:hypothetical protein
VLAKLFFDQNPGQPSIQQKSAVMDEKTGVTRNIGKILLSIRAKYKQDKLTELLKERIHELNKIPAFGVFLQEPSVIKPKPLAEHQHTKAGLELGVQELHYMELKLMAYISKTLQSVAKTELEIWELTATSSNKKRRARTKNE